MTSRNRLQGKVALITGASRGLGKAMALALAEAGAAALTITAGSSAEELERTAGELERVSPGGVLAAVADVARKEDCERVVGETIARFGRLDILINNAAKGARYVGPESVPFWQADPAGWRMLMDTNVDGPFFMARAAVSHMLAQKWGRIINVSKNVDTMHERHGSPYGPSKAALDAMTISWAQDLAGTGVTVNALSPGGQVDTRFGTAAGYESAKKAGRLLPDNVLAPAAVWLASEASSAYSGGRFSGRNWRADLPPDEAARLAWEPAAFRRPGREPVLPGVWDLPA